MNSTHNIFTDIPGIKVGHAQNMEAMTGCTVILCPPGTIGGVDQRGGAPGTRETDLLHPMHLVQEVHAVLLTGGSAFGLDAATGVMRFLEEHAIGFDTGVARVPIVVGAVLFDLDVGNAKVRPDAQMGYHACINAVNAACEQGNVGAGTGARVGNLFGKKFAMKSGIGSACIEVRKGLFVGALMAVNSFGDIIQPDTGKILAGTRSARLGPITVGDEEYFANTLETMRTIVGSKILKFAEGQNTIIGAVATNARLTKEQVNKVAQMAQDGIAMTARPAHSMLDGDTIFALATNQKKADVNLVGAFAAQAVAQAIINAVVNARPLDGLPSATHRSDT